MSHAQFATYDLIGRSELMGNRAGTNGLVIHRGPSTGGLEGVKDWLDKRSLGPTMPQNKYLVAGAAAAGLAFYAYKAGWFGR